MKPPNISLFLPEFDGAFVEPSVPILFPGEFVRLIVCPKLVGRGVALVLGPDLHTIKMRPVQCRWAQMAQSCNF